MCWSCTLYFIHKEGRIMKKLSIVLLLFVGVCTADDAPKSVPSPRSGGHLPAVDPKTGQMYGVNGNPAPQGLKNPPKPSANKNKKTIQCTDGYAQEWVGQGDYYVQCSGSPDKQCCECLIARAVCTDHQGMKPNTDPLYCDEVCKNPAKVKAVIDDLQSKVTPEFLVQIKKVVDQPKTGLHPVMP